MAKNEKPTLAEKKPAIFEVLLAVVSVGAGKQEAARQAGISDETLRKYEKMGADALAKLNETDATQLSDRELQFATWYEKFQTADGNLKVYLLQQLRRVAKEANDSKAAMWLLSKKWPKEFGDHVKLEVDAKVGPRLDLSKLSLEEKMKLRELTVKAMSHGGNDDE